MQALLSPDDIKLLLLKLDSHTCVDECKIIHAIDNPFPKEES